MRGKAVVFADNLAQAIAMIARVGAAWAPFMLATTIVRLYAEDLRQTPSRPYASDKTTGYAFADVRRSLAKEIADGGFGIDCQESGKSARNPPEIP